MAPTCTPRFPGGLQLGWRAPLFGLQVGESLAETKVVGVPLGGEPIDVDAGRLRLWSIEPACLGEAPQDSTRNHLLVLISRPPRLTTVA